MMAYSWSATTATPTLCRVTKPLSAISAVSTIRPVSTVGAATRPRVKPLARIPTAPTFTRTACQPPIAIQAISFLTVD